MTARMADVAGCCGLSQDVGAGRGTRFAIEILGKRPRAEDLLGVWLADFELVIKYRTKRGSLTACSFLTEVDSGNAELLRLVTDFIFRAE